MPRAAGTAETQLYILDRPALRPERKEALRYLGYPPGAHVDRLVEARLDHALGELAGRVRPRGMYALYPVVGARKERLELAGGVVFTGRIGEFLGGAHTAAAFLATAGPEIVGTATETLRAGDRLGGLVYDALGSALAEAMVEAIVEDLRLRLAPGEVLSLPYSPGYCGIPLQEQRKIFRLLDASRIGVELLPTLIMRPVKTISGLIGIGSAERVRAYGNPCDRCPLTDCRMRR